MSVEKNIMYKQTFQGKKEQKVVIIIKKEHFYVPYHHQCGQEIPPLIAILTQAHKKYFRSPTKIEMKTELRRVAMIHFH